MKLIPLCCGNPKCIGNCGGNGPRRPAPRKPAYRQGERHA